MQWRYFPPSSTCIDRDICVVVDLTDVGSDMNNGNAWRSTSATLGKIYNVTGAGEELRVWPGQGSNWYTVFRNRYTHKRYKDWQRLVISVEDQNGVKVPIALIQYRFDGTLHAVHNHLQGNKGNESLIPTKKTVIKNISLEVQRSKSKVRFHFRTNEYEWKKIFIQLVFQRP